MLITLQIIFLLYCSLLSILTLWVPLTSHIQTMSVMNFIHASLIIVCIITMAAVFLWRNRLNKALSFVYTAYLVSAIMPNIYYVFVNHVESHMTSSPIFSLIPLSSIAFFIAAPEPRTEEVTERNSEIDSINISDYPYGASGEMIERHHYSKD